MKGQELDGEEGDTNGFSVHLTGKGHMITIGAPQYKWKLDKDHAFFNAAVEPLHSADYEPTEDDEVDEDEDDEGDEGEDEEDAEPMLTANAHRKRVALSSKDEPQSSAGKPFERPKNFGNGRVRVLGAFHCEFLGDIVPPENPY